MYVEKNITTGRLTSMMFAAFCSNTNRDIDANLCYHGYTRNLSARMAADVQPLRDQLSDSDCILCAYRSPSCNWADYEDVSGIIIHGVLLVFLVALTFYGNEKLLQVRDTVTDLLFFMIRNQDYPIKLKSIKTRIKLRTNEKTALVFNVGMLESGPNIWKISLD